MRPVLNRLLDLRKIYGASAEGYWQSCFNTLSFETHPSLGGDPEVDADDLRNQYEANLNGLQRAYWTSGMTVKTLAPAVTDPTPHIDKHIEAICICLACPVPVFKGYEIGEQASENNDSDWNTRVKHRQQLYLTPMVICPFVDRCIMLGILPEPEGYSVEWPDINVATEAEKAAILLQRTQAYAAYVAGNLESMIPPKDYMTRFDDMEEEEADEIIDAALEAHESEETMTMPPQIAGHDIAPPEGTAEHAAQEDKASQFAAMLASKQQAAAAPPGAGGAPPPGGGGAKPPGGKPPVPGAKPPNSSAIGSPKPNPKPAGGK